MTDYPVCPDCGEKIINPGGHAEACTGPRPQSPLELAELIAAGGAFVDADAVRVARAYLEERA